jgi:ribosomal subunit interface protein
MTVEIKGAHGYAPGAKTREYIEKKTSRLDHVKDHVADLHLVFNHEKSGEYVAESNIHFRWGAMSHIKVTDRDLFKAIDTLFDKIDVKTTKEKGKIQHH